LHGSFRLTGTTIHERRHSIVAKMTIRNVLRRTKVIRAQFQTLVQVLLGPIDRLLYTGQLSPIAGHFDVVGELVKNYVFRIVRILAAVSETPVSHDEKTKLVKRKSFLQKHLVNNSRHTHTLISNPRSNIRRCTTIDVIYGLHVRYLMIDAVVSIPVTDSVTDRR